MRISPILTEHTDWLRREISKVLFLEWSVVMNFFDYIWIIKLAIEILKILAQLKPEDRAALHKLKDEIGDIVT